MVAARIGTLNEGPLHQALKELYRRPDGETEVEVDGFVADVRQNDGVLYEIQTGGFWPLKKKLERLVRNHRIVLVHPIPFIKYIVKSSGCRSSRRRSPSRGRVLEVLDRLVSVPRLLAYPNFALDVLMTEEEEHREHAPREVRRRRGWRVVKRQLVSVHRRERFGCADDLFRLVSGPLPEEFTTAELSEAMEEPRWIARRLAYCLREAGAIEVRGKRGNAFVYTRVTAGPRPTNRNPTDLDCVRQ